MNPLPAQSWTPPVRARDPESAGARRAYHIAAWAFVWLPVLAMFLFYVGDAWIVLKPIVAPISGALFFGGPILILAAIVLVLRSRRKARWLFAVLNCGALFFALYVIGLGSSFTKIYQ